jgi:integrase
MSIRKREWKTPTGEPRTAWLVDYRDQAGTRRAKQFDRKRDADQFLLAAKVEVGKGTHTADSQSITVAKAGERWLARARREGLEQTTIDAYDQHLRLHIVPYLGARKLNQLTRPAIEEFRDTLLDSGRSKPMAKRVLADLSAILKEAMRLGFVAQNVASGVTVKRSGREKPRAMPPTKAQIRQLLSTAEADDQHPMRHPMLLVFVFAGLRASEVRGLPWRNVDLKAGTITVDQRADRKNVIGPPKSASGFRTISIPPSAVTALKKWKLRCPTSKDDLVFPSEAGTPIFHANVVLRFQEPLQISAGLCRQRVKDGKPVTDSDGAPVMEGLFGLHDLRHACASLWIEQRVQPKRVQTWMGHHSIQVTYDTYGHLFDALEDDAAIVARVEAGLGNATA